MPSCKICNKFNCKKHEFSLPKKWKKEFTGSTPPEIFVGRWNYPNVYSGILAPEENGNTQLLSSPELWHKNKLSIPEIMSFRNRLIYGRRQSHIKSDQSNFSGVMKEIAMTHKSVSTQFILEKPVRANEEKEASVPKIARAAPVKSVKLQENAPVKTKIDSMVSDSDVKSRTAMKELYKSGISAESITKLLSAGLLGQKTARRMVPTRWSITAVDDTLSKQKLEKIKFFQELSEIRVFDANYLGNYYNFILLPETYSFEVIEISTSNQGVWQDYESNFPRSSYADSVTGAYYANRLALTEYLESIQRQAACLVLREIRPEYSAPCGVGILRQLSREAFSKTPETFDTIEQALAQAQTRMQISIANYTSRSQLLKNTGKQKRLTQFF